MLQILSSSAVADHLLSSLCLFDIHLHEHSIIISLKHHQNNNNNNNKTVMCFNSLLPGIHGDDYKLQNQFL